MSLDLEMEEIHKIFFEESFEGLDVMESRLLNLDVNADRETINSIFRAAHSIKGGAATFGFMEVSNFTHGVETLLDEMRNGTRPVTPDAIQLLLQSVDGLREMVKAVQAKQPIDTQRIAVLSDEIAQLLARHPGRPAPVAAPAAAATTAVTTAVPAPVPVVDPAPAFLQGGPGWVIDFRPHRDMLRTNNEPLRMFAELARLGALNVVAETDEVPSLESLQADECYLRWRLELAGAVEKRTVEEVFDWVDANCTIAYQYHAGGAEASAATPTPVVVAPPPVAEAAPVATAPAPAPVPVPEAAATAGAAPGPKATGGDAGSIRVSTTKVDHLINLVGELVITQSMLSRFADGCSPAELEKLREGLTQLTRNTRELQESVMQIRMLPISFAFNRFPRLVHDLSRKLGKKVELKLSGEGTELDKTVLEKISDPLVHLVRNALDHGLEKPEVRIAAGKPETGTIELAAFHEGGNIIIEVKDDGGGLHKAKILARARERGLVAADAELSDDQIHNLIFAAGFSTADSISDVSGRGVGMDVVRRNIQDLGGVVQIASHEGRGSTIRIRLPLTLAILDGQLVRVGADTYVISLVAIVETIQAQKDRLNAVPGSAELFRLRDEYIPVVRLYEMFGVEPDSRAVEDGLLVVVEAEGRRFGVLVDDLLAQQQVVIKTLETNYRQVAGVAGATILGDGTVALIIDVPGLVQVFNDSFAGRSPLAA
ncbi:MAG: chemotaxis protein CheA [Proteobacteria bacterium]|nr:chemotaxis protein CheA [Pseudomonadota bacterium]